jgi:hypothetical protein
MFGWNRAGANPPLRPRELLAKPSRGLVLPTLLTYFLRVLSTDQILLTMHLSAALGLPLFETGLSEVLECRHPSLPRYAFPLHHSPPSLDRPRGGHSAPSWRVGSGRAFCQ